MRSSRSVETSTTQTTQHEYLILHLHVTVSTNQTPHLLSTTHSLPWRQAWFSLVGEETSPCSINSNYQQLWEGKLLLLMLGESYSCTDGFMLFLLLALQNPRRVLISRLVLSTDKDRQLVLLPCVLSFRLMWCNHSHRYALRGQAVKFWMAHLP